MEFVFQADTLDGLAAAAVVQGHEFEARVGDDQELGIGDPGEAADG